MLPELLRPYTAFEPGELDYGLLHNMSLAFTFVLVSWHHNKGCCVHHRGKCMWCYTDCTYAIVNLLPSTRLNFSGGVRSLAVCFNLAVIGHLSCSELLQPQAAHSICCSASQGVSSS